MKRLSFILLFSVLFFACEEVPVEIPDAPMIEEPDTSTLQRIVLFEELTGVSCPPCYDGALAVDEIQTLFPGRVAINGIHGGFQSNPTTGSKYDFRYDDARALENSFFFLGKPAALVDRVQFEDQDFLTLDVVGLWRAKVQERLDVPVSVSLKASSSFDANSRRADFVITAEAVGNIDGNIKIYALINENNLVDSQERLNSPTVLDFKHKHVMKEMLTSVDGDLLVTGMATGESYSVNYSYTIPDEVNGEWIPENMDLVFYLTTDAIDGEVLQAGTISIL